MLLRIRRTRRFGDSLITNIQSLPPTDVISDRTVPLFLLSADENGKVNVDKSAVLAERETSIAIDTSKPFKLNADTNGVCEYPPLYSV